jgi:hypothetical protein
LPARTIKWRARSRDCLRDLGPRALVTGEGVCATALHLRSAQRWLTCRVGAPSFRSTNQSDKRAMLEEAIRRKIENLVRRADNLKGIDPKFRRSE